MATSMTGNRGAAGLAQHGNAAGGNIIPKGHKLGQIQQFTPEQMQLFQQLFSNVGPESYLSRLAGGDEASFQHAEAPAWRAFGEAQGQLGSRFSQLAPGAMSAQRGSGFKNAAGQLGSDFASQLASQRHSLQSNALSQMTNISNSLLGQRPYERSLHEKQMPFWQQATLGTIGAAGDIGSAIAKFTV